MDESPATAPTPHAELVHLLDAVAPVVARSVPRQDLDAAGQDLVSALGDVSHALKRFSTLAVTCTATRPDYLRMIEACQHLVDQLQDEMPPCDSREIGEPQSLVVDAED